MDEGAQPGCIASRKNMTWCHVSTFTCLYPSVEDEFLRVVLTYCSAWDIVGAQEMCWPADFTEGSCTKDLDMLSVLLEPFWV